MRLSASQSDFIEEQARLRMGRFSNSGNTSFSSLIGDLNYDEAVFPRQRSILIFKTASGTWEPVYAHAGGHFKNEHFAEDLTAYKSRSERFYVADFQDCTPWRYEPFEGAGIPVFGKNRPVDGSSPIILWTNRNYRARRESGIKNRTATVPWNEKLPSIVWRGAPHGHLKLSDGRHIFPPQLLSSAANPGNLVNRLVRESYGTDDFCEIADRCLVRYALVSKFSKKYDVAFAGGENRHTESLISFLSSRYRFSDKITRETLSKHKYMMVLEGNDAGTQINWALSSNSVILMPEREFHSTTTLSLREWVHYVPVSKDFSDLEERLDWCRSHDDECRQIADNAMAYAAQFQPKVEDAINRKVLKKYNGNVGGSNIAELARSVFAGFRFAQIRRHS